jgi:hypothetical protein
VILGEYLGKIKVDVVKTFDHVVDDNLVIAFTQFEGDGGDHVVVFVC